MSTSTKYFVQWLSTHRSVLKTVFCTPLSIYMMYNNILYDIVIFSRTHTYYYTSCEMCFSVFIALGGSDTRLYCFYYFLNAGRASWHIIPLVLGHYRTMVALQYKIYRRGTCLRARCIVTARRHIHLNGVKYDYRSL